MIIKKEIDFVAPISQVWDLLTNPSLTKQYMFGCEVLSDWDVGSPIIWKGMTEDGKEIIYVKGEITHIEKGKMVTFTMLDPNMGIMDIPENYANLTYELLPIKEGTRLLLTQGDYATGENGKSRYEDAIKGWDMVLPIMKGLLE